MSKFGIDVSDNQGRINWPEAVAGGVQFAILRTVRGSGKVDYQFEANYAGCRAAGVLIGGYKYGYATNAQMGRSEAEQVISLIDGRPMDLPIWYDTEDKCQRALPKGDLADTINAFLDTIRAAGYRTGVYCNLDWYKNVLPISQIHTDDWWIARYGANNGRAEEQFKPSVANMSGWQYTSRGRVPGISGNVDCNILYRDYAGAGSGSTDMVIPFGGIPYNGDVLSLQQALNYDGVTDAKGMRLAEDGKLGSDTKAAIGKVVLKAGPYDGGWYRVGSEGVMVNWLQIRLNELIADRIISLIGHLLTEDGRFGNDTRLVVGLWQEMHGLKVDYICGPATITSLL